MVRQPKLQFAAKTDPGLVRARNEDAISLSPDYGLAVLADGMGGYNAGDVASRIAADTIKSVLEEQLHPVGKGVQPGRKIRRVLTEAVEQANAAILAAAHQEPHFKGMGTTVVVAVFQEDKAIVAHVGDSRLYRWRDGQLNLLTRDHSLLQEQIDAGLIDPVRARLAPNRNLITRALGVGDELEVEVHEHPTQPGDLYLLCSDGLSDMLSDAEIGDLVWNARDLNALCNALVLQANANGGYDNTSVVLVAFGQRRKQRLSVTTKLLRRIQQVFRRKLRGKDSFETIELDLPKNGNLDTILDYTNDNFRQLTDNNCRMILRK